jgi:hypothetical protein
MATHRMFLLAVIAAVILVVSCAAPVTQPPAPTQSAPQIPSPTQSVAQPPAATQTTAPTAIPTKAAVQPTAPSAVATKAAPPTATAKLNMDEIFPPGPGRELVLDNCSNCHTIVPIVTLQMEKDQWDRDARDHRDRVPRLTDAEFRRLYDYLIANFNPQHPIPKLPKELLDTWTDY